MTAIVPADQLALPPGFRFHPTDEELVNHYLRRKVLGVGGLHPQLDFIPGVDDLCKYEPWELPDRSFSPSRDNPGTKVEWYLFSPIGRNYPNGLRMKRGTQAGFWKSTGKDRPVLRHHVVIGMKKTLVYHLGRAPHGIGTGWIMHEYRLHHPFSHIQNNYALCRVFNKNVMTPTPDLDGVPFVLGGTNTDKGVTLSVPSGAHVEKDGMHLESSGADTDKGGMQSMASHVDVDKDVVQFVPDGADANKDKTWMEFICNDDYWKQFISDDTWYSAASYHVKLSNLKRDKMSTNIVVGYCHLKSTPCAPSV